LNIPFSCQHGAVATQVSEKTSQPSFFPFLRKLSGAFFRLCMRTALRDLRVFSFTFDWFFCRVTIECVQGAPVVCFGYKKCIVCNACVFAWSRYLPQNDRKGEQMTDLQLYKLTTADSMEIRLF
jgi:hypothetical protein